MGFITKIDIGILKGFYGLASKSGAALTPFAKLLTFLGEKGWIFLVLAVILALFPKTRKPAVCIFGAIACTFLISNLILKDWIGRVRPYEAGGELLHWWYAAGHVLEPGFSCPSGHAASAFAGVTAIWFMRNRERNPKGLLLLYLWPLLMAFSRCYLMAHYPSDCLLGFLVGGLSAYIAWFFTEFIWILLENHKASVFGRFCLEADVRPFFAGLADRLGFRLPRKKASRRQER